MDTQLRTTQERTIWLKSRAAALGFDYCGIAAATFLEDDALRLEAWLQKGMHGSMGYMERNFDKRLDPRLLVPGAKSVVTLMLNYFPSQIQHTDGPKISKYAYGQDYHDVIRAKLNQLLAEMQQAIGEVSGRGFVDSAPVLERSWAKKSGMGWIGKNGQLLQKGTGSFFFLATLILDVTLAYDDHYAKDYCGSCTKCIDACPTQAIVAPSVVDGSKCISYLTIEWKEAALPDAYAGKMDNWAFGCDVCQDVCPWNRFAQATKEPGFTPLPEVLHFNSKDWLEMELSVFNSLLKHSPIKRAKQQGFLRNLRFLKAKPLL